MGLIEDIRGRKLTGCRGCDAIRAGLYRGLDFWLPETKIQAATTHDSFNASALGAYIESPLGARGSAETVEENTIIEFNRQFFPNEVVIFSHGDGSSFFTSGTKLKVYIQASTTTAEYTYSSQGFEDVSTYSPTPTGWPDVDTPIGYTETHYAYNSGGSSVFEFRKMELLDASDDSLILDYTTLALIQLVGSDRWHRTGYYKWTSSIDEDFHNTAVNYKDCVTGVDISTETDGYTRITAGIPNGFNFPERNPLTDGTLSPRQAFTYRVTSGLDGSVVLTINNDSTRCNVPSDHPNPVNPCYWPISPGVRGLGGVSGWGGADLSRSRTDTATETQMELSLSFRSNSDESAPWLSNAVVEIFV